MMKLIFFLILLILVSSCATFMGTRESIERFPSNESTWGNKVEPELFCKDSVINEMRIASHAKHAKYKFNYKHKAYGIDYVSVTHIGSMDYFNSLRKILKQSAVVIEEGVLPSGFYGPPYLLPFYRDIRFESEAELIQQTRRRLFTIKIST